MSKLKVCPGSNRWAPAALAVGKGRCPVCNKMIVRNMEGILFTHKRSEKAR